RQAQLERERMLYDQQMADADVSMTVEERRRQELQENAINMAREHPEDVALLIRTWLMEE
ncbi:flagellar M-ring protein FliF, partial [Pectobacterium polaris]|nr:flagellar M-ring protein FliF [Pectobacterium polaris]